MCEVHTQRYVKNDVQHFHLYILYYFNFTFCTSDTTLLLPRPAAPIFTSSLTSLNFNRTSGSYYFLMLTLHPQVWP